MGKRRFTVIAVSSSGNKPCGCPQRLSYKTVDSYIGKSRSIFHAEGRDGEWDKRLGLGNPAADKSVKDYLRLVPAEQLQARITPKQATPFFVDKLTMQSLHLQSSLSVAVPSSRGKTEGGNFYEKLTQIVICDVMFLRRNM